MERIYRDAQGNYHRERLDRGVENHLYFVLSDPWQAWNEARKAARAFSGMQDLESTVPWVAEMGPWRGWVVGSRSPDGLRGWRLDLEHPGRAPSTPGHHLQFASVPKLHVNWEDRTLDPNRRNRDRRLYGANYVVIQMVGAENGQALASAHQQMFWEILSHFPGQAE